MAIVGTSTRSLLIRTAVFFAIICAMILIIHHLDTRWRYVPFVTSITLFLTAIAFALSRRVFFSLIVGCSIVLVIAAMSLTKFDMKGFALHYYDFVFTGFDIAAVQFLLTSYPLLAVALLGVLALVLCVGIVAFRLENRLPLATGKSIGICVLAAAAVGATHMKPKAGEPDHLPYAAGYNGSAFFLSLADIRFPLGGLELAKKVHAGITEEKIALTTTCGDKRPDIVMILSESQTDLANFPQLAIPQELKDSFRSQDGNRYPLYVEVFGGSTWVTNFSVMTGLSASDFGWQRDYVTQLMEGRVRGSLPETLAKCGYRTVTVMPMLDNFVNEGPFLRSIGIQEVMDARTMGIEGQLLTTDTPYFDFVEKLIAEHQAKDKRPLFLAMQTLATHGPYDRSYIPESAMGPTSFSDDTGANEYVRRVSSTRARLGHFLKAREANPGDRGSVVVEYGDHQSVGTLKYLSESVDADRLFSDPRGLTFRTFFAVHGYNYPIDYTALKTPIDAAYLSASIIQAAGLPTSPLFEELATLRDACKGRFHSCEDRTLVDNHLNRRANSGLLTVN